jgi:transposase
MKSLLEHLEAAGESCTPQIRSAFFALEARLAELEALVRAQAQEIRELKRRLNQNSMNSSLPPSSDPPFLKPAKPKKPSGRRRGGQSGHEPHQRTLLPPERVDRVVEHSPNLCRHCGHRFALPHQEIGSPERRQVIELPPIRAEVVEHRLHRLRCPVCRAITPGIAPAAVTGPVTFGARLVAFSTMLTVRLRASRRGVRQVLGDLLDVGPPCVGQLQQLLEEASTASLPAYQQVRAALRASPAIGVDETSWTLRGRPYWLWAGVTSRLSFFRLAARRSGWARERLLGRRYAGVVTSDRHGAYNALAPPQRQLCWAHLKRDFVDWQGYGGAAERIGHWAEAESDRLFALWHRFRAGEIDRAWLRRHLQPLQARVRRLLERGTRCGVRRVEKSTKQLLGLWPALWSFALYAGVEPTNNEAERALRAGVIWRKTSFGSQSGRGLRLVERLLTVAETCKKQNRDLLGYLTGAIEAHRTGRIPPLLVATP